jgi:uncharacterized protein YceK
MKKLVIIGIVALLVCVGLSGCSSNSNNISSNNSNKTSQTNTTNIERNKFIGTWNRTSYDFGTQGINLTVVFFLDGTLKANNLIDFDYANNWEIKDGMLTVSHSGSVYRAWNYVFSNNYRTLTLTLPDEINSIVYTKH